MFFQLLTHFAASCSTTSNFLSFPTWYEYLPSTTVGGICTPELNNLTDVWLIVAAAIEILLRVATLVAVGYTMYGGFRFVTSQGEPGKTAAARDTIINGLTGLAIAIIAGIAVGFIAGRF